ncbi:MAG: glutamate formimidoyltransferase, partial [Calditrichaeota bacterium]|nr:glutamate formimidoyltransferase [Calditrichota bacterium]
MMQLVECVPNFSEGRDQGVIQSIADAISCVNGVQLLHVDPNSDANRTVVTFVGESESVGEAAFQAISRAAELIDMRRHQGAHPRLGAADVCPFVPLAGVSLEKCVRLARRVGERVGRELAIPVYFYGAAADPNRRRLADIRRGEYEGLPEKLAAPEWRPDCGPAEFKPMTGATIIGSRNILIAFNVNLNTTDQARANEIALAVREKGPVKRDAVPADGGADGQIVR